MRKLGAAQISRRLAGEDLAAVPEADQEAEDARVVAPAAVQVADLSTDALMAEGARAVAVDDRAAALGLVASEHDRTPPQIKKSRQHTDHCHLGHRCIGCDRGRYASRVLPNGRGGDEKHGADPSSLGGQSWR